MHRRFLLLAALAALSAGRSFAQQQTSLLELIPQQNPLGVVSSVGEVRFRDKQLSFHTVSIVAPDTVSSNYKLTLPANLGSVGQALTIANSAGALTWSSVVAASPGAGEVTIRHDPALFNTFTITAPDGTPIDTTGTTTAGWQEAINYAHTHGFCLHAMGGEIVSGGAFQRLYTNTPLTIPNSNGACYLIEGFDWFYDVAHGADASKSFVTIDSSDRLMFYFIGGQIIYPGNADAVLLLGSTANGESFIGNTVSEIKISSIPIVNPTTLAPESTHGTGFRIQATNGPVINNDIWIGEINGGLHGFVIDSPPSGKSVVSNRIVSPGIHSQSIDSVLIGTDSSAAGRIYANKYQFVITGNPATSVSVWGGNGGFAGGDGYDLSILGGGASCTGILLNSSAAQNGFNTTFNNCNPFFIDNSTSKDNYGTFTPGLTRNLKVDNTDVLLLSSGGSSHAILPTSLFWSLGDETHYFANDRLLNVFLFPGGILEWGPSLNANLNSSGGALFVNKVSISTNLNSGAILSISNTNSGPFSQADLQLTNDVGNLGFIGMSSSGHSGNGSIVPNQLFVYSNAPSGTIVIDNLSGYLDFATGGTTARWRMLSTGDLQPRANVTYNIGDSTHRFLNAWGRNIDLDGLAGNALNIPNGGAVVGVLGVNGLTSASQVRVSATAVDGGLFLTSTATNNGILSGGSSFDGNNWIAKSSTGAVAIQLGGTFGFGIYTNTGLTNGFAYTPTLRAVMNHSGHFLIGTSTDSGGGELLQVNGSASVSGSLTGANNLLDTTGTWSLGGSYTILGNLYLRDVNGASTSISCTGVANGWVGISRSDQYIVVCDNSGTRYRAPLTAF